MLKNTFLLIVLLTGLSVNSYAQKFQLGLSMEPCLTQVISDYSGYPKAGETYHVSHPLSSGLAGGVSIKYKTGRRWFFQTSLLYGARTYNSEIKLVYGSNLFNPVLNKYVYKTTSIDIPLTMNYLISTKSIQPYLCMGLGLRAYVSQKAELTVENHTSTLPSVDFTTLSNTYLKVGFGSNFLLKNNNVVQTQICYNSFLTTTDKGFGADLFNDFTFMVSYFHTFNR